MPAGCILAQSRGRAGASRPRSPVRFVHSSAAPTAPPQGSSKAASQMGSHSTSGHTEGTESASPSPSPHRSPHHSARSSRAGATDTFPRTVSTQKAPQVDPSPPIHTGKIAPLPLPKIPTKSETFAPPHFRPADGRPTPLQPFRLRLQGFRSVGLPSAPPTLRAGPDHTPPQIISNQTIPDPPRLSRRGTKPPRADHAVLRAMAAPPAHGVKQRFGGGSHGNGMHDKPGQFIVHDSGYGF